jgi:hypothetical protein
VDGLFYDAELPFSEDMAENVALKLCQVLVKDLIFLVKIEVAGQHVCMGI